VVKRGVGQPYPIPKRCVVPTASRQKCRFGIRRRQVGPQEHCRFEALKAMNKPFFLGVGFWKPHLPFNAPKKYWDLYDRNEIPLPSNRFRPENLPDEVQNSREIYAYACVSEPEDTEYLRELRHGYYACVSYVDAQIGMILNALKSLIWQEYHSVIDGRPRLTLVT